MQPTEGIHTKTHPLAHRRYTLAKRALVDGRRIDQGLLPRIPPPHLHGQQHTSKPLLYRSLLQPRRFKKPRRTAQLTRLATAAATAPPPTIASTTKLGSAEKGIDAKSQKKGSKAHLPTTVQKRTYPCPMKNCVHLNRMRYHGCSSGNAAPHQTDGGSWPSSTTAMRSEEGSGREGGGGSGRSVHRRHRCGNASKGSGGVVLRLWDQLGTLTRDSFSQVI